MNFFRKYSRCFYILGGCVAVGVLAFTVTVNMYSTAKQKIEEPKKVDVAKAYDEKETFISEESSVKTNSEVVVEEKPDEVVKEPTAVKTIKVNATPVKKEVTFISPVEGDIVTEFALDKLVYSETLDEWITHNGVDIKAEEATPVKATADGKIQDIKLDPRYGYTIIIKHDDGYVSIYSNLSTIELVGVNKVVKQGDIISGVGKGYGFELGIGPHIHYELMKDGKYVKPL